MQVRFLKKWIKQAEVQQQKDLSGGQFQYSLIMVT